MSIKNHCPKCGAKPNQSCIRKTVRGAVKCAATHKERNDMLFPELHWRKAKEKVE